MASLPAQEPGPGVVYILHAEACPSAMARGIEAAGWTLRESTTCAEFHRQLEDERPACVLLELSLPEPTKLEVQHALRAREIDLPMIFLTAGEPAATVEAALRDGAFDFIAKSSHEELLIQRIGIALLQDTQRSKARSARKRIEALTKRELEICGSLARGLTSKEIARELSISARTVHHHRDHILHKTGTANAAELATLFALSRGEGTPQVTAKGNRDGQADAGPKEAPSKLT